MGVDTTRLKVTAFVLAAFFAGTRARSSRTRSARR
jgi:hypothetical protein